LKFIQVAQVSHSLMKARWSLIKQQFLLFYFQPSRIYRIVIDFKKTFND